MMSDKKTPGHHHVCAVRNCFIKGYNSKNRFYRFPKDTNRARIWAMKANREDLFVKLNDLYKSYSICENHFEEKMFTSHLHARLVGIAIPTLFPSLKGSSRIDHSYSAPPLQLSAKIQTLDDKVLVPGGFQPTLFNSDGIQEQSYIKTGELVLEDDIKKEVEDDVFTESLDKLLITKEDLLTIVSPTNSDGIAAVDLIKEEPEYRGENEEMLITLVSSTTSDEIATVDLVKQEPEYTDANEPPKKKNRLESDQISNDSNQPGPSRLATTDDPQPSPEIGTDVTHIELKDPSLDNMLTCSKDLDTFFKALSTVAKTLDPIDQVILQKNISNVVFDMKIKEMTSRKS